VGAEGVLKYKKGALMRRWNGRDLWSSDAIATLQRPSRTDVLVRPWIGWIPTLLAVAFVGLWAAAAASAVGSPAAIAWAAAAAAARCDLRPLSAPGALRS